MPGGNVFHGAGLLTDDQIRNAILIPEKPASAPIGDYSLGESVFYKSFGAVGYPQDTQGTVRTSKTGTNTAHQTFFPNDIDNLRQYERYWEGGFMNWTAWKQHIHSTLDAPAIAADLNTLEGSGFWHTDRSNVGTTNGPPREPGDHPWIYITQIQHNANYRLQTAWDFTMEFHWERRLYNGTWGAWTLLPNVGSYQRVRNVAFGIGNGVWATVPINSTQEKATGNVATYNADHTWTVNRSGIHTLWWDAGWENNSTGQRLARWLVGSQNWSYFRVPAASTSNFFLHATGHIDAGTVVNPLVWQNSGAALNLTAPIRMSITRLGP